MSDSTEDVTTDVLFVGLTRPATAFGIPYAAFMIEFMAALIVFLGTGNPLHLSVIVPMHGILYLISAKDPQIFEAIAIWLKTSSRCVNFDFWGARSFSPLAVKKWAD